MRFWLRRPGLRRRLRLARGAGIPDKASTMNPFVPVAPDADHYRAEIERYADSLANSVDDATGHALHSLVNAWADQWIANGNVQYSSYLAEAAVVESESEAREALSRQLWMAELTRLMEVGLAVEATLTNLIDEEHP